MSAPNVQSAPRRRSWRKFALVALALLATRTAPFGGWEGLVPLGSKAPHERSVAFALGRTAEEITGIAIDYTSPDGEFIRSTRLRFDPGAAPRVVTSTPRLGDGEYVLKIDVDTVQGRRSTERRITLSGPTSQVDLSNVPPSTP
jgi:hypothetical protein